MSIEIQEKAGSNLLEIHTNGRLTHRDYLRLVLRTKRLIEDHGKIRVLLQTSGFDAWSVEAMWDDIRFELDHFSEIERVALVGENTWEKWMAGFYRPFTGAESRFFAGSQIEEARQWLEASPRVQSA